MMMSMEKEPNIWLWLMMPEDSSSWESNRSFALNLHGRKGIVRSISKVLFWYGAALSLTILIGKLH